MRRLTAKMVASLRERVPNAVMAVTALASHTGELVRATAALLRGTD